MREDLTVLIPSRRRVDSAALAARLLPFAQVFVNEAEAADYGRVVGPDRVVTHAETRGIAQVRAAALQWCPTRWLVMVDDDFKGVFSFCGRRPRKLDDPADLYRLIENQAQACDDLGLTMFCWNRSAHPGAFRAHDPLNVTAPIAGAFGIAGKDMRPHPRLVAYEDVDLSMQCLLKHRIILCDNRFYWNFGRCWQGRGGNQGVRTSATDAADRAILKSRWGPYLEVGRAGNPNNPVFGKSNVFGMKIRVDRKSAVSTSR